MILTPLAESIALVALAAALTLLLNKLLHPVLVQYALARPNARSSHKIPTPQGGGIAVVGITLAALAVVVVMTGPLAGLDTRRLCLLAGAAIVLAAVGAVDDIRPLPVLVRLVLQFTSALAIVASLPPDQEPLRALPFEVPVVIETAILVIGLVWFINLTNFMDGIDWITVVEVVPITLTIALMAHAGAVPKAAGILALLLAGGLIGFAPVNKHVARLFLGDVGSLPIGALVGWLLIVVAGSGQLTAALILPLYYIADSGITLIHRWMRGEKVWKAHRSHYYQRALDMGYSVPEVTSMVLRLNLFLAGLALVSVAIPRTYVSYICFAFACFLTWRLLRQLERGKL